MLPRNNQTNNIEALYTLTKAIGSLQSCLIGAVGNGTSSAFTSLDAILACMADIKRLLTEIKETSNDGIEAVTLSETCYEAEDGTRYTMTAIQIYDEEGNEVEIKEVIFGPTGILTALPEGLTICGTEESCPAQSIPEDGKITNWDQLYN